MTVKKDNILITSALLYVNGIPHLGHLTGCLLPADIMARFYRLKGKNVLWIGGTDEHGAAIEIAADKAGMTYLEYATKMHNMHKELYDKFNLSLDYVGRTSDEENHKLTQEFFQNLYDNGYIYEKTIKQIFSVDDNRFLSDRQIVGTCPHCGFEKAKGDQCDGCTKLLDPTELINAKSVLSGSEKLEQRDTKHLFLKLSEFQDFLSEFVEQRKDVWCKSSYTIAKKWLGEGLQDRCITRDLSWGVKVPLEGFDGKVFYVWFDAPIGYISITEKLLGQDFKNWWLNKNDNVEYIQFMGKDNTPFHSVIFPSMIEGTKTGWKQVDNLKTSNYLNFEGGKFSKSENRGIFMDNALEEFPADYYRYFLFNNYAESDDSNFSFEKFAGDINTNLNNVFGNFVSRVIKFSKKNFTENVYNLDKENSELDKYDNKIESMVLEFDEFLEELEFRKAAAKLKDIWSAGNEFLEEFAPWKLVKGSEDDKKLAYNVMVKAVNYVNIFALCAYSIMPETVEKLLDILNLDKNNLKFPVVNKCFDKGLFRQINGFENVANLEEQLFFKIDEERIEELKNKYI